MTQIRETTNIGNNVYVGQFRIGNTKAIMKIVFGKDI